MRKLLVLGALLLSTICVNAQERVRPCLTVGGACVDQQQQGIPAGATMLHASSGNVANASAAATFSGAAGVTNYLCGFTATASGATAAAVVNITASNLIGAGGTYTFVAPAGATAQATPLVVNLNPCVPASGTNTSIVVTLPALGAGNTNAAVNSWGYRF